ncbi:MAG: LEA type 2 family protein [Geminicoccaceae bacterium]
MARLRRALCLALSLGVAACAPPLPSIEPPEVSLVGLTLGQSGLLEQRLWVDLRLGNPNAFDVAIERLQFALEVNHQRFGRGRLRREVELPARGEVVVPVLMTIATSDLIGTMMELSGEQQLPCRLIGEAELDHVLVQTIPFEWRGRLELPRIAGADSSGA